MRYLFIPLCLCSLLWSLLAYAAVPAIPFTVTMSEAVNVTGSPRIVLDVDGNTRYAVYAAGTGTASLTFTYTATAGDVDLNGIGIASTSVDLNGGTVTDLNGNPLANLTFTAPANMASVNVNYPSLSMNFIADADGRYSLNGTVYNDLTSFLAATGGTFSRASVGTYYDSTGTLQTAASGAPRFDYDPSTLAFKGLLMEEARTNQVTNSQFSGAGIGVTPSGISVNNGGAGITGSVTGVGTLNGENFIDVTFTGTNSSASTIYPHIAFASNVATVTGEVWSARVHIISNTGTSSTSPYYELAELTSGGAYLTGSTTSVPSGTYISLTRTMSNASTARTRVLLITALANGQSINRTFRVSVPQFEKGIAPTSYIPTTSGAVTRATDVLSMPTAAWFNSTTGTITGKADMNSLSFTDFGATLFTMNDNTAANYIWGFVRATSGQSRGEIVNSTTQIANFLGTNNFTAGTAKSLGIAYQTNNFSFTAQGASLLTDASGNVPTLNKLNIGSREVGSSNRLNGHMVAIKYYPLRVSDTQLQLLTQ